jgi:threonine dehydrogenase-like Zn-dependent dehydrogenase
LSDFVVVPEYCVVKIPDNVPLDVAGELIDR